MVSLLHNFFLVFAEKDEQPFFHNFQAFFQLLKFFPFVSHFVVAVVVVVLVVVELYQFLELFFWLVLVRLYIIFVMFPVVKNKIEMRFVVYSKPVGSVVDFWKK